MQSSTEKRKYKQQWSQIDGSTGQKKSQNSWYMWYITGLK